MQKLVLLHLLCMTMLAPAASTDLLQNSDFESPPSKFLANSTAAFVLLNENNTIPGWSVQGTVQYVTAGPNISLPGNGHAIRLDQDGKINQTFTADGNGEVVDYLLSFTIAPNGQDCLASADLIVSAPDSELSFPLQQRHGKQAWESHGQYLGTWGDKAEPINLVFRSQTTESDPNMTCWPIIDKIILKGVKAPAQNSGNLLANGRFEWGPAFLSNSSEGILLNAELNPVKTALQQWAVIGTVKYIDSEHCYLPERKSAIEIVSGVAAGIQTVAMVKNNSHYNLDFMLGDANDSCAGKFIEQAQAGVVAQNFSLTSNGTGGATRYSLGFKSVSDDVPVSFLSYTTSQTRDGVFCGPVIDGVILRASSHVHKLEAHSFVGCLCFVLATLMVLKNDRFA